MEALQPDTIFAPATAAGRAAIAIIRLSGPAAGPAVAALAGKLPPPRAAHHVRLRDPDSGEELDDALALWFPGPHSVTGEDVAEFHVHGSRAVIAAIMAALSRQGLRLAEPGEFTRRAFLNDKLDLVQAEAVADLAAAEIAGHLADGHRGERLRDGIAVAIVGPPNAGKSSLLNQLARREAAITSPIAGTTRDVIEVAIDLAGYPVVFADTAGLRESADAIEQEGLRRALARAEAAELRLFVFDARCT